MSCHVMRSPTPQIIRTAQYRAVQNSRIVDVSNAHAPSGILPRECRAFDPWFALPVFMSTKTRGLEGRRKDSKRERKKREKKRYEESEVRSTSGPECLFRFVFWPGPVPPSLPLPFTLALSRSPLFSLAQSLPTQRKRRLD